jgi:1,4-alpha-glucan branching enzyme
MTAKTNKKIYKRTIILLLSLFSLGGIFSEEAIDWLGSYSSQELEGNIDRDNTLNKIYYYWQIQSLKRAVSPRYIRLIDIDNYIVNNSLLNKGILFTYNGIRNEVVEVCGNFSNWRCLPMQRNRYGIYYAVVPPLFKGKDDTDKTVFEYKFRVDGIFDFDPVNREKTEDGEGSFYSIYKLPGKDFEKQVTYRVIDSELDNDLDFKLVEFRIYMPEANTIALVGDFNQWNPEHDYLYKESTGRFILRKKLKPGEYLYNYIADGHTIMDTFNSETRYRVETDDLCSYLKINMGRENRIASDR